MNRQIPVAAILAFASSAFFMADAQDAQPPVRMPTQKDSWNITIEHLDAPQSPHPLNTAVAANPPKRTVMSISVDLDPPLRRDVIEWSDKSKSEVWRIGGLWLVETPQGVLVINHLNLGGNFDDWHAFEDSHFDWTADAKATPIKNFKGRPALLYERERPVTPAARAAVEIPASLTGETVSTPEAETNKLWVDAESHLPLAIQEGRITYVFQFRSTSSPPLKIPEKFQMEYDRFRSLSQTPPPFRRPAEPHR